ncbi:bifunctional phosphopantothenoylcysteine decarboxylase/phosphopantothenate--cysteine ligase CoaBC [Fulvivirgaceae bacterium BMA10]|uniref:Coenzyme A biosynthesis bifunctional protein CoaBC n=1 Tax=Splendidivirga corallicola TaxID=3051826 RepID=A0ABT8KIG2_9BACT|nr:bifunctional phosphopantothenoylcysteine decarboxylase/phosphopantothenate--cysteine ligase CoaBC [Fulvivirgaceae bacterium BMA10]
MLQGKKIILGVCGSIAAYKAAMLTRLLIKEGAEVRVIMTEAAKEFITPLTLSTLSKNPVLSEFIKGKTGEWNNHVELGLWADALVVAPATANTIAKMAHGQCDNLLTATYLSARCPVFLVPAMDLDMYQHQSTLVNLAQVRSYGNKIIDAEYGELASGLVGTGRMAEPEHIMASLHDHFSSKGALNGKKVLITAGPTYEMIDPVRFIGNHSSGKMGYALAQKLAEHGAEVTLISGPSKLEVNGHAVNLVKVCSAEDMYRECVKHYPATDIAILAAAVADYTPDEKHQHKLKKKTDQLSINLVKTKDIAAELGKIKRENQINIGFALETENEKENALKKLTSKNFDFIVLNSLQDKGAGFGHDTNKITIIDRNNTQKFELKNKMEVAEDIINSIISKINA